jgi:hypothetical protein
MTLDASGNLSVGTTSSGARLEVHGAAAGSSFNALRIANTDTTASSPVTMLFQSADDATLRNRATMTSGSDGSNNGYLAFSTRLSGSLAERMRINSSGNLLVGTTSAVNNWNNSLIKMRVDNGIQFGTYSAIAEDLFDADSLGICYDSTENLCFGQYNIATATYTERARIDSSGNLLVAKTSANGTSGVGSFIQPDGRVNVVTTATTTAFSTYELYSTGAANYRFYVTANGGISATITTITSLSDQRLKENIRDLDDGLDVVMALKPRKFDWKEGKGADIKNARGFIAQEFETVFPDMVDVWKDPAPEGEDPYKSVRADLIPTLVKAIQEQQALITQLQADVAALKGASA